MSRRTDAELLATLRAMTASGEVGLVIDAVHLDKADSPVSVQAESTRWLYGLVAVALAAAWAGGAAAFAAAAGLAVALWYAWVRRDVARRIRHRVETAAFDDVTLWRRVWRFGGVILVPRDGGGRCTAPGDNWMQFVRDRRPAGGE